MGGSSSSSSSNKAPVEAPNNLLSTGVIRILDALCEGQIKGFAQQSGAYGSDPLCSTYYDNVPVRNLDGSYNFNVSGQGYSFYYTLGTSDQQPLPGFAKAESIVPLSSNTQITSPPVGAGLPHNVTATFSTASYPDADSVKLSITIPALYTADNEGNVDQYTISFAVDIALNNGPFQNYGVRTITGKCTSPYLETFTYTLPKASNASSFCQWTIRVRKTSTDVLSVKTQASMYVSSVSVVTASSFVYPNTVLVGSYMLASQFSSIPNRAYLIDGLLVSVPAGYTPTQYTTSGTIEPAVYPAVWTGNFQTGVWTDNPAWVFYDVVTNKRYGLGRYMAVPPDKWSLYQISQYCDEFVDNGLGDGKTEPRFTLNTVIAEAQDAYNLLQNLSSVFRGMVYYANGTLQATQTADKSAVYNYTNANVIDGQFTYADSSKNARATVALVHWRDPANLYRETVEYIEDTAGIQQYGYVEKELTAFACTSRGQAYRLGNWVLTSERLLTETVSFRVGYEGLYIRPGDVFNIYDNFRTNRNQCGRVVDFDETRTTIRLDRSVPLESGVTYVFSAITPKATLSPDEVTGSSEIALIRNSQIETYQITTAPTSGTNSVTINAAFSTGLFAGTPWIISASGGGNMLNNAGLYQCLSAAEVEPGIFEVVGLQYNTGVNRLVDNGYNVVRLPANSGDQSPITPPSDLTITLVTGTLSNNTFYSYLRVGWTQSTGANLAYNVISGQPFGGNWTQLANTTTNAYTYVPTATGFVQFRVAAVSNGGVQSEFITGGYTVQSVNPLGYISGVTGLRLTLGADSTYLNANGYPTGYIESTPAFAWSIPVDANGNREVSAQFISGYKFSVLDANTSAPLIAAAYLSGSAATTYQIPAGALGTNRLFKAQVETIDLWGNLSPASTLIVNNPAPLSAIGHGATATAGGFSYAITPNPKDIDISGVYLWYNESAAFTPTAGNVQAVSPNIAGTVNNELEGVYYVWYSLVDTFGQSVSTIGGPLRVDALSGISGIQTQLALVSGYTSDQIALVNQTINQVANDVDSVAGNLASTGSSLSSSLSSLSSSTSASINNLSLALSQTGSSLAAAQSSLSSSLSDLSSATTGQITSLQFSLSQTGTTLVGQISTLDSKTNSLSGYTNAQISNQQTALTTTSGALASSISSLTTTVGNMSSSVTTLANAYIVGGQAVATWGFQLDANNKVVSMQAIAASGGSQPTLGTIIFGGADLQSDNYSAGTAGWKLTHDGNLYANTGTFRGLVKASAIDHACTFIRDPGSSEGGQLFLQMPAGVAGAWAMDVYSDNGLRFFIEANAGEAAVAAAEFQASLYAREYLISSSRALKQNIRPIGSTLEGLKRLEPVAYERRYMPELGQYDTGTTEFGFVAEDTRPIFPEVVVSGANGHLSISYPRFAPLLVQGLKEEDAKVAALERRVKTLEDHLARLSRRLSALEQRE
jgi:predicted phage tail protein